MRDWVGNDSARQGRRHLNDGPRRDSGCAGIHTVLVAPNDTQRLLKHDVADPHPVRLLPACTQCTQAKYGDVTCWACNNLDPECVNQLKRKCDAHIHQTYIERYGPGPKD